MKRRGFIIDSEKLFELYRRRGWSQQDLAQQARLDVRTVAKLRRGGTCDASTLRALAETLGIAPDFLLLTESHVTAGPSVAAEPIPVNSDESTFVVEHAWKIIDLRNPLAFGKTPCGAISEHYRVRPGVTPPDNLILPYLTWGDNIECIEKPEGASWTRIEAEPGDIVHSDKQWELSIPLPNGSDSPTIELSPIRLLFRNAFHGNEQQWWQVRAAYPTESLTIQVLFSSDLPCRAVKAAWTAPGQRKPTPMPSNTPIVLPDGTMAAWHISRPVLGAFYKLSWSW